MEKHLKYIFIKIMYYKRILFRPKIVKNYGINIKDGGHISEKIRGSIYRLAYERAEIEILTQKLKPNDKVLEIGSGLGFLTTFCAKTVGDENIVGYEANPFLIEIIKDNFRLNNVNPTVKNAILGDVESEIDFFIEDDFWSSSVIRRSDSAKVMKLQVENINDVLLDLKPNFLVVDIEGGEKELIYKIDFGLINKILIEIHPHIIGNDQATRIISYLSENGFELDFLVSRNNVLYFLKSKDELV